MTDVVTIARSLNTVRRSDDRPVRSCAGHLPAGRNAEPVVIHGMRKDTCQSTGPGIRQGAGGGLCHRLVRQLLQSVTKAAKCRGRTRAKRRDCELVDLFRQFRGNALCLRMIEYECRLRLIYLVEQRL